MTLADFVDSLNLPFQGEYVQEDDAYVINVSNSNAWDRLFIILESNDSLYIDEDNTTAVLNNGSIYFKHIDGVFYAKLLYNFTDDLYQCRIGEINEEIN